MSTEVISRERRAVYSPIGLRVIDAVTGQPPRSQVSARLFRLGVPDHEEEVPQRPVMTPSGILTYPGLERRVKIKDPSPVKYRVELTAQYYMPQYRSDRSGLVFDAYPYNDESPPKVLSKNSQDVLLLPAPDYPFGADLRVVRGVVRDLKGLPVPDVILSHRGAIRSEQALSDDRGAFSLPLRFADAVGPVSIEAVDLRTGRQGTIRVALPNELGRSQSITIH